MEAKSNGFLKVTGILMIIGGVLSFIVGIIAVLGVALVATIAAAAGAPVSAGLLTFSCILVLVSGVVSFVAGIMGVKNANKPEKAQKCIVIGIIVIILSILGTILSLAAGGKFNFINLITGLIIPVLYLLGAFQNKKAAADIAPVE